MGGAEGDKVWEGLKLCLLVGWLEQWNTRSRKRKTPQQQRSRSLEEGYSVETTDTDDDSISHPSAVASPAPSQRLE